MVNNDNIVITSQTDTSVPPDPSSSSSTTTPQTQTSQSTMHDTSVETTEKIESHVATTDGSGTNTPLVNPIITQPSVLPVNQGATQANVPLVTPSNHAPLKMVSVPINSDVITQGNSQVVLIPVGGMDTSKLQSSLKVPEGQKLVIIKPQEILKTIEQKKSKKNPAVLGISSEQAKNLTQPGVLLQTTNQGGLTQAPMSSVGKLIAVENPSMKKGLVKLAPKGAQNIPGCLVLPNVQVTNTSNILQPSLTVQKIASPTTIPLQKPQTSIVVDTSNPKPSSTTLSSVMRLQAVAKQVSCMPSQTVSIHTNVKEGELSQGSKAALQSAKDGGVTYTVQPKLSTSTATPAGNMGVSSQTASKQDPQLRPAVQPNKVQSTNSIPGNQVTSQTGLNTSKTSLTTCQTAVTSSNTSLVTSTGLPVSKSPHTEKKTNLYETLKQKIIEERSVKVESNTANVQQTSSQESKVVKNAQSNAQQIQINSPSTKTPQKIIVTYVSPDKPTKPIDSKKTDSNKISSASDKETSVYTPVSSNSGAQELKNENPGQSVKVLNTSNVPTTLSQPGNEPKNRQLPSNEKSPADGQAIKIYPIRVKNESEVKTSDITSTNTQDDCLSIEEHESTLNDVVEKRGRPRKSVVDNKLDKKSVSGPTLKHELERRGTGSFSGRAKTVKPGEHQIKAIKHKRVSNTNPWICALCGKTSYVNSLGCLFGPYEEEGDMTGASSGEGHTRDEGDEPQAKRKRGSSEDGDPPRTDLWFHGDCMVWSPGVYSLADSLVGYNQVVKDAKTRVRFHILFLVVLHKLTTACSFKETLGNFSKEYEICFYYYSLASLCHTNKYYSLFTKTDSLISLLFWQQLRFSCR